MSDFISHKQEKFVKENFLQNIKRIRKEKNISLEEFSKMINVPELIIKKYENENFFDLPGDFLINVMIALDVSVDDLLDNKNDKNI